MRRSRVHTTKTDSGHFLEPVSSKIAAQKGTRLSLKGSRKDMIPHSDDVSYTQNKGDFPALMELRERQQWVCWRKELRKGKPTKVPYNPRTGHRAESDNPATWARYEEARQALANQPKRYHGLGFMFHSDYTGIDLDHCVNPDGTIDPWAHEIIVRLVSWAEYSPSDTGIHILVRGTVPRGIRRRIPGAPHPDAAIEIYSERRYFTMTGKHVEGTPVTIEDRGEVVQALHTEITAPPNATSGDQRGNAANGQDRSRRDAGQRQESYPDALSDDDLLRKAMNARDSAKFRALWTGDTAGYLSQSEAEAALCTLLAFWTGKDPRRIDRLFRRSALYRSEKWDQPARSGETYGEGTITRAMAHCREVYNPEAYTRKNNILHFPARHAVPGLLEDELVLQLPDTGIPFVLACLRDEEEGDARLYAHLFGGRCIYDHTDGTWYEWRGHYWERDECKHALLLASGPLASAYLETSARLSEEMAQLEKKLDPDLLKDEESETQRERYGWLKATTGTLISRARALKKLKRAQSVLTYAQAYLRITARRWDTDPWLLGTRDGVLDLRTGTLRDGQPEDYIRTIIPTSWQGLDIPAPRFEQFLQEIFADREQAERDELILFLQRALGYGISGHVLEHIFLMLYGEEGRNGKDTLMSLLAKVLGSTVGAVSNDVIIASGKLATAGSAKPHLVALQGKRIAWASETDRGARFDASQVKFLTGGGAIPARQLYGKDYSFDPSHLLVLLTNNKPHADARDRSFWSRLCPILFNMRFVDRPTRPNERQKDMQLGKALEAEASGILAWLVRGCLAWQQHGLLVPASVVRARQDYQGEEDTLGQFFEACCVFAEHASVKASHLYERYKSWAQENSLKPMTGTTFGLELKKLVTCKRDLRGVLYVGIGLLTEDYVGVCSPKSENLPNPTCPSTGLGSEVSGSELPSYVGLKGFPYNSPYESEKKWKEENYTQVPTTLHSTPDEKTPLAPPVENVEGTKNEQNQPYIPYMPSPVLQYVETIDGLGYRSGNTRECDVTFTAEEKKEALRWKIGVISLHDGRERFYYPQMMHDVSADVVQAFMAQAKEVPS